MSQETSGLLKRVGMVLLVIFLGVAPRAAAQSLVQDSPDSCSTPVSGFGGIEQIACPGVEPAALARLNALLIEKGSDLPQKIEEANEWAEKYRGLSASLTATVDDREVAQQARALILRGEFDKAGLLLDQLLAKPASQVDRLARDHFNRAQLFDLQFQTGLALPHYEQAYRSRPHTSQYAFAYGMALYSQREDRKALDVAENLYRLAVQQGTTPTTQRLPAVERNYKEALALYRALATRYPDPLRPVLAGILNDLGVLYGSSLHPTKAEIPYQEALAIRRVLAAQNPDAFRPDLAQTLNNLGILYSGTRRATKAVGVYEEALAIRRALAAQNPDGFRPAVAQTLNNLGILYRETDRPAESEAAFQEALAIRRALAVQNPETFRPEVATTLHNFGYLYYDLKRYTEAETAYQEALAIRRALAVQNPDAFRPKVAATLWRLTVLYKATASREKAQLSAQEALKLYRDMGGQNADLYRYEVTELSGFLEQLSRSQ
jgi:tetratricopeptide (TPR) repeat protein